MPAKNSRVSLQTLSMPSVGIGSWQSEKGEVGQAVDWALEAGVRLIDTAAVYMNEGEIGEVLKKWLDSGKILIFAQSSFANHERIFSKRLVDLVWLVCCNFLVALGVLTAML